MRKIIYLSIVLVFVCFSAAFAAEEFSPNPDIQLQFQAQQQKAFGGSVFNSGNSYNYNQPMAIGTGGQGGTGIGIGQGGTAKASIDDITNVAIAPTHVRNDAEQKIEINAPKQYLPAPVNLNAELNFIQPDEMEDVTLKLPKFALGQMMPLNIKKDNIVDVLYTDANVKYKSLYKAVLKGAKDGDVFMKPAAKVRYQIIRARSAKTWTLPGGGSGSGSGFLGTSAASGTLSLMPSIGRSKTDNLYTVFFLLVE